MIITKEKIEAVLAGCDGVTPGPWTLVPAEPDDDWLQGIDGDNGDSVVWPTDLAREPETGIKRRQDAAHIARLSPEFVHALATLALEALSSRESGWQGRIKPLEWVEGRNPREDGPSEPTGDWEADSPFGAYSVDFDDDDWMADHPWCCWTPTDSLGHFPEVGEAKAAAQADYESRIRSALLPNPPDQGSK